MANPTTNTGPTLPGRPSYVYDHKTDCFVGPGGVHIPAEWVPTGKTMSLLDFLYLLIGVAKREEQAKAAQDRFAKVMAGGDA